MLSKIGSKDFATSLKCGEEVYKRPGKMTPTDMISELFVVVSPCDQQQTVVIRAVAL